MEKENAERKRECGVVEMHRVIKSKSCNGQREVQWKGEGRRRYRAGLEVLQTRRTWSQIPIAGVFNLPLSGLSRRSWP